MDPILKEERREMKRLKTHYDMLHYVADTQYEIPTSCPCGGRIVDEISAGKVSDTLPGKRFFTCNVFKDDGLHFKQPWVFGVQEEIKKLTRRVEEAEKLQWQVYDLYEEIKKLKRCIAKLEKLPSGETDC